jgi:hypothetical protein
MAVVDLASAVLGETTPLLEQLAMTSGLLLVVCGQDGDAQEEVFVRQVGAWLYLPGGIQAEQLTVLCSEALALCTREANQQTSRRAGAHRTHSPRH